MTAIAYNRPSPLQDLKAADGLSRRAYRVWRVLERTAAGVGNGFRMKHETIAARAKMSISTVQRALKELTACNMLRTRANARTVGNRNYRLCSTYWIKQPSSWCFSERLKALANVLKNSVRHALTPVVSVKNDRSEGGKDNRSLPSRQADTVTRQSGLMERPEGKVFRYRDRVTGQWKEWALPK